MPSNYLIKDRKNYIDATKYTRKGIIIFSIRLLVNLLSTAGNRTTYTKPVSRVSTDLYYMFAFRFKDATSPFLP